MLFVLYSKGHFQESAIDPSVLLIKIHEKGSAMKKRAFELVMLVAVVGLLLGGCGCFQQQMKGESAPPPPPAVVQSPEAKPVIKEEPKKEVPPKSVPAPAPQKKKKG